jgi:hypothetical protein
MGRNCINIMLYWYLWGKLYKYQALLIFIPINISKAWYLYNFLPINISKAWYLYNSPPYISVKLDIYTISLHKYQYWYVWGKLNKYHVLLIFMGEIAWISCFTDIYGGNCINIKLYWYLWRKLYEYHALLICMDIQIPP